MRAMYMVEEVDDAKMKVRQNLDCIRILVLQLFQWKARFGLALSRRRFAGCPVLGVVLVDRDGVVSDPRSFSPHGSIGSPG